LVEFVDNQKSILSPLGKNAPPFATADPQAAWCVNCLERLLARGR
jgi:hypothetical protein